MKGGERYGSEEGERLVVSGGSSTLVGTDTLLAQEAAMRALHAAAQGWTFTLVRVRALDTVQAPAWSSRDPGLDVLAAATAIDAVEADSRQLADALRTASEGYGLAERQAEDAARVMASGLGWALGRFPQFAALVAVSALPAITVGVVIWLLRQALTGAGPPVGAVWRRPSSGTATVTGSGGVPSSSVTERARDALLNSRSLTSPLAAALVRLAVSSLDDVAVGALGLPPAVAFGLGDDGMGLLGVTTSAAGLLAVARPNGLLRETRVTVAPVPASATDPVVSPATAAAAAPMPGSAPDAAARVVQTTPPAGIADLASRIPSASTDGGQVRIERYGTADAAAWVVYIGGTVDWSPVATAEPWDLTSNLSAVAEEEAGSYRAVVQAMREAGIRPGEPVIEVGHSQGGLIAAQVAASGDFTSVGTVTFGAPSGSVVVPAGVDAVAVEHTDDIIPGMGGSSDDAAARLMVRREVYGSDPVPDDVLLPAHSLTNYIETARLIDSSPEPRLRAFREQMAGVIGSAEGSAAVWRGARLPHAAE